MFLNWYFLNPVSLITNDSFENTFLRFFYSEIIHFQTENAVFATVANSIKCFLILDNFFFKRACKKKFYKIKISSKKLVFLNCCILFEQNYELSFFRSIFIRKKNIAARATLTQFFSNVDEMVLKYINMSVFKVICLLLRMKYVSVQRPAVSDVERNLRIFFGCFSLKSVWSEQFEPDVTVWWRWFDS